MIFRYLFFDLNMTSISINFFIFLYGPSNEAETYSMMFWLGYQMEALARIRYASWYWNESKKRIKSKFNAKIVIY